MTATADTEVTTGRVVRVTGPVVDERTGRVLGVTARAIDDDGTRGPDIVYRAPVVVAADGNSSRLSLAMGLRPRADRPPEFSGTASAARSRRS